MRYFLCGATVLLASQSWARPDRNAFLNHTALSITDVVTQVQNDAEVRNRFCRHFAMDSSEVVAYFRTLRLTRLKEDSVLRVYSVPPNDVIKMHVQKFRAGTAVYVDSRGVPTLVARCANPLNLGPGSPELLSEDHQVVDKPEILKDVPYSEFSSMESESVGFGKTPQIMTPEFSVPSTQGASPIPVAAAAPGLLQWLLAASGVGGMMIGPGGGGNDGPPAPVPEPATAAALVMGAGMLAARRRRR